MSIDPKKIIELIEKALEVDTSVISVESNSENTEEWDSLGHLSILIALDKAFNGKIGSIKDMATADSASKIISLLDEHSLDLA